MPSPPDDGFTTTDGLSEVTCQVRGHPAGRLAFGMIENDRLVPVDAPKLSDEVLSVQLCSHSTVACFCWPSLVVTVIVVLPDSSAGRLAVAVKVVLPPLVRVAGPAGDSVTFLSLLLACQVSAPPAAPTVSVPWLKQEPRSRAPGVRDSTPGAADLDGDADGDFDADDDGDFDGDDADDDGDDGGEVSAVDPAGDGDGVGPDDGDGDFDGAAGVVGGSV